MSTVGSTGTSVLAGVSVDDGAGAAVSGGGVAIVSCTEALAAVVVAERSG
ncbi:MAG TPA: hypothetical protein VIH06_11535 [Ilumatobacteraceae bacterium]